MKILGIITARGGSKGIPGKNLKLLGGMHAVNISAGLPIVRTSVAHGTAYDIAWQGKANECSMIEAARVAARIVASGECRGQRSDF